MIIFAIILLIIIITIQIRSMHKSLKSVTYDCHFSKLLVEPGEEFEIIITITNKSRAFIPFIKIEQAFPSDIKLKEMLLAKTANPTDYIYHTSTLYLMPRSKYIKRVTARFPQRGRYIFPGTYLRVGDFLALGDKVLEHKYHHLEVVVYPKTTNASNFDELLNGIMGDISVRRLVLEDPIMTVGFRDYSGREPMKAISWNQSAKTGKLMVKQFDHTVEASVSVILDVEGRGLEGDADKKEAAFSYVRSLCELLESRGMKYDFLTNATTADAHARWSYKPEGSGLYHFAAIMEGLGRTSHNHVETLDALCKRFVQKKNYDRFVILVTIKHEALIDTSYIEKSNGGKVYILSMEDRVNETGILSKTAI